MSTTTQTPRPTRWGRATPRRVLAWVLLAGWVAVMWALALTGTRTASWDQLAEALQSGQVDEVTVVGEEIPDRPGSAGFSLLEMRWRHGGLLRRTEVEQRLGTEAADSDAHVVRGSVTGELRALSPGLRVETDPTGGGASVQLLGLRLEGPAATAAFGLGLATLFLLVAGPEPERATKWAWFWLMSALPPVACPAYLLLGGMVRARPEPSGRRLTGGWAFLLALLLGGGSAASR